MAPALLLRIRLIFAAIGAVVFFFGIRAESDRVRWIGVSFVAVAWLMRFVPRQQREADRQGPSM